MDKILVPTDFSEHSGWALEYASFLAGRANTELYILHIVRNPNYLEAAQDKLDEILSNEYLAGMKASLVLEEGNNVGKTINKVAENLDVELIVMGSNGASNVEEIILGSNTENVIIKTRFDVLTIKHQMISPELNSIMFPSNFKPEAYGIFDSVMNFAREFDAEIQLVKIGEESKKEQRRMDSFVDYFQLADNNIKYKTVFYPSKSLEIGILNYAVDNNIDLIAIGTHGKGAIKKLLQESISQNLVRDAFRPVLTMRF